MSGAEATEALRELTQTLRTPWTISLYRQAAIAITKRQIRGLIKTGDHETLSDQDKDAAFEKWLGSTGSPVIFATSALGVGCGYAHVRWVIHAGAPRCITDFSQESGRSGLDGKPAESIILLSESWLPRGDGRGAKNKDEEFMQLYLTQQHCSRAVMSQHLDTGPDWRWCMEGEDEL